MAAPVYEERFSEARESFESSTVSSYSMRPQFHGKTTFGGRRQVKERQMTPSVERYEVRSLFGPAPVRLSQRVLDGASVRSWPSLTYERILEGQTSQQSILITPPRRKAKTPTFPLKPTKTPPPIRNDDRAKAAKKRQDWARLVQAKEASDDRPAFYEGTDCRGTFEHDMKAARSRIQSARPFLSKAPRFKEIQNHGVLRRRQEPRPTTTTRTFGTAPRPDLVDAMRQAGRAKGVEGPGPWAYDPMHPNALPLSDEARQTKNLFCKQGGLRLPPKQILIRKERPETEDVEEAFLTHAANPPLLTRFLPK